MIKNYSKEEEIDTSLIPKHPFRLLIIGESGSGKSNLLLNFIYDFIDFENLFMCAKDIEEPIYQKLQEDFDFEGITENDVLKFDKRLLKMFNTNANFYDNLEDMVSVNDLDREQKNLVVFDDCICEKNQNKIIEFFIRGRKQNASIIYLTQSFYDTPRSIRLNCNMFIFFAMHIKDLKRIINEIDGTSMPEIELKPHDFLLLDKNASKPFRFRKNLNLINTGSGFIQQIVNKLPFEAHIPGYSFCGPGTRLEKRLKRGDQAINRVDEVCKKHDIAYSNAKDKQDIRMADKEMIQELDSLKDLTIGEKVGKAISKAGIKTKMFFGSGSSDIIYCLKCKKHTETKDVSTVETKNNRKALTGFCNICGVKKFRFLGKT